MKIAHLIPTFSAFGDGARVGCVLATEQKDTGNDVIIFALEADKRLPLDETIRETY